MKTTAAVLVQLGQPLALEELEIPPLQAGQALVEIAFSGVCHTQVLECRGARGKDPYLPHCLGHEGSGTVLELGSGVSKVKAGDRVILSWMKGGGADVPGAVYQSNGRRFNAGGITTFMRRAVISENRLTLLPEGVALREAALLGCAVPTGLGAVLNTAQASAGKSLAVFGVGGIGLCAVAGAALAGCSPIIAVDIHKEKLAIARRMGATHEVCASEEDPVEAVRRLCPGGADFAVEASGRPAAMLQSLQSVRHQGGTAVVVGNARHGERVELDPRELNMGKRLLGTWGGDNAPDRDFPKYCLWVQSKKLDLSPLGLRTYPLGAVNQALDDLEAGRTTRPLIDMKAQA